MKLIAINWHPNDRQLRQFGIICLVALPLVGWIWGAGSSTLGVLAGIGLLLAVAGIVKPRILAPLFLGLTLVATPIGMVLGELAMLLIYFTIFLPIGLAFRLLKRDALRLKIDRDTASYWQAKKQPKNMASYYRQS